MSEKSPSWQTRVADAASRGAPKLLPFGARVLVFEVPGGECFVKEELERLAGYASLAVFGERVRGSEFQFGLARGSAMGEFSVGGMSMMGSLSNGFDVLALEFEESELVWAAVELVRLLAEGRLEVVPRKGLCRRYEVLVTPIDWLPEGRRSHRAVWWNRGGPYERAFLADG